MKEVEEVEEVEERRGVAACWLVGKGKRLRQRAGRVGRHDAWIEEGAFASLLSRCSGQAG